MASGGGGGQSKKVTEVRDGLHQECCLMVRVQADWPSLLRAGEECVRGGDTCVFWLRL